MARTFVKQTQVSGSNNFTYINQDARLNIHNNPGDLLNDINSIRSVIKDISGESEYYLSASLKSLKNLSEEMKYFLTSSAVLHGTLTVNNNISLNNDAQIRLTSNTANTLFGMFDGTILGPYYQMWGNNHASTTQRGTAEFVFDTRNNGGGFNIAGYDGNTWVSYFKIDRNGDTNITGSLNIINGNLSGSNGSFSGHLTASSLIISDPITLSNQAVNKSYVDSLISSGRDKETQIITSSVDLLAVSLTLPTDINKNLNVYLNGVLLNCSGSNSNKADVLADGLDASQKDSDNAIIFSFDLQVNDIIIFEKF